MTRRRQGTDRAARIATALAAGFLLATFVPPDERPPPAMPELAVLEARPVPLDRADRERRRLGGLLFLEGWRLSSRDVRFGGLSAMHVESGAVTGLSDSGNLFRFSVPAGAGELPVRILRVPRGPGSGRRKGDRDGEALVVAGASAWIAWEGRNAVWRYRRSDWRFEAAAAPPAMRRWPSMGGPEAMARLEDGRFLVIAEGPEGEDGTVPALLFDGDPALAATPTAALAYRPPRGFRPTDAALLPDGRLLVLNRRFRALTGFSAVLTVAELPPLREGTVIEGRELASFTGSVTRDNYEALSVTQESGRTIVWLASDDNYTPLLQATLLMKFALAD